jgi:molecular chaperone GrpE
MDEVQKEPEMIEKEKYLRLAADFENYKKDEARRIESALRFGSEKLILEVLDAVDDLEAAYHHAPENTDEEWLKGLKQVLKRFGELLHKHNVQRIATVGEKFDPIHHEAVQMVQAEGPPDMVVKEIRAGYTMNGKVIRPARVIINK